MIHSDIYSAVTARPPRERRHTLARTFARGLAILLALIVASCPIAVRALDDPNIAAETVLLVDPDTGTVLLEHNADERRYPASITKVMTALVVLEHTTDLSQTVTVDETDFANLTPDSSVAGFQAGEVLTIEQLLYGLLLPSGNEASYALARTVGGTVEDFVQMMNDKAVELGCTDTHFTNPCGLHDPDHYTTARDLERIVTAAMEQDAFARIVSTSRYDMPATNLQPARELYNSNLLVNSSSSAYYEPAIGVKTGNTTEAGRCLAGAAEQDGVRLYSVVLGCTDERVDGAPVSITETRRLFTWAYDNWIKTDIASAGDQIDEVPVTDARDDTPLELSFATTLTQLIPADSDLTTLEVSYDLPSSYTAPIEAGEVLGTATYTLDDRELGTVDVVAANDVELSPFAAVRNAALALVSEPWFPFVAGGVAAFIVGLIVVSSVRRRARTRRAAAKRHCSSGQHYQ